MKKQTLKSLALHKKTVSNLDRLNEVKGGASGTTSYLTDFLKTLVIACPKPQEPEPLPASNPEICTGPYGNCPINI
ncbi:hypothetical protein [uncultured Kordia sp.]|uniref:hypothetical protein n=1 Tax=uncultured Kordia sp. TaxID=507699 RepID=UPI002627C4DC|nr:hypothetical protein [uncultured Kordia sp.]